jgi:hypothetical protein
MEKPTQNEIDEARVWWNQLPSHYKGNASIWTILAMYAKHWAGVHTVSFEGEEPARRIVEG